MWIQSVGMWSLVASSSWLSRAFPAPHPCLHLVFSFDPKLDMALTADQKAAKLDSDLKFVLANLNVPIALQAAAYDADFTTLRLFSIIGDDRPSARQNITDMFGINLNENGLAHEAKRKRIADVAKLVAAWEKCTSRTVEIDRDEAARASSRLPRQMSKPEVRGTKSLFERQFFKIHEGCEPAKPYVEKLDDRLQDGEFRAELLTDVLVEDPQDVSDDETFTIDRATTSLSSHARNERV